MQSSLVERLPWCGPQAAARPFLARSVAKRRRNNVHTSAGPSSASGASAAPTAPAGAPAASSAQPQGSFADDLFKRAVEGKSFFCTQCGKCCTGSGEVWVSEAEAERIASHLNMSMTKFCEQYTKQYDKYQGWKLLKSRPGSEDCIFLVDKLCSIHNARPSQCSTYPWWPELMSADGWKREKDEICEGFDHPDAPPLDVASAAAQLKQATRDLQLRTLSRRPGKGDSSSSQGGQASNGSSSAAAGTKASGLGQLASSTRATAGQGESQAQISKRQQGTAQDADPLLQVPYSFSAGGGSSAAAAALGSLMQAAGQEAPAVAGGTGQVRKRLSSQEKARAKRAEKQRQQQSEKEGPAQGKS